MKKSAILAGTCVILLIAGSAFAGEPSAKFAATWTTQPGLESAVVITDASQDTVLVDRNNGYTLATIKVPQDKELLVGVSAEIGIVTYTSIKGKNGGTARAIADGEAYVTVFAVPKGKGTSQVAAPGQIILSKRVQELDATLGGVIQSCSVSCETVYDEDLGEYITTCGDIVIADDCIVDDEEIGLLQDTTAAHHFNFVLPNMDQGLYDIVAFFTTGARAEVDVCDPGEACYDDEYVGVASASSLASAIINKTMVTVQQVRAAKDGVNLDEINIIE